MKPAKEEKKTKPNEEDLLTMKKLMILGLVVALVMAMSTMVMADAPYDDQYEGPLADNNRVGDEIDVEINVSKYAQVIIREEGPLSLNFVEPDKRAQSDSFTVDIAANTSINVHFEDDLSEVLQNAFGLDDEEVWAFMTDPTDYSKNNTWIVSPGIAVDNDGETDIGGAGGGWEDRIFTDVGVRKSKLDIGAGSYAQTMYLESDWNTTGSDENGNKIALDWWKIDADTQVSNGTIYVYVEAAN